VRGIASVVHDSDRVFSPWFSIASNFQVFVSVRGTTSNAMIRARSCVATVSTNATGEIGNEEHLSQRRR